MTSPVPHVRSKVAPGTYTGSLLNTPIPGVGVLGSLTLLNLPTDECRVAKGTKITVTTSGTKYVYYATADVQATDQTTPLVIPVAPEIQAVHAYGNNVYISGRKLTKQYGVSVIGDILPISAKGKADGESQGALLSCVPHLRAWPWATDIHGIPYDQANLLALSFYQVQSHFVATKEVNTIWNYGTSPPTVASANVDYGAYARTNEERYLIAVPKTALPAAYTRLSPRKANGGGLCYYQGGAPGYGPSLAYYYFRSGTARKYRPTTIAPANADWLTYPVRQEKGTPSSSPHDLGSGYGFLMSPDPVTKICANGRPFFPSASISGYSAVYGAGCRGGTYSLSVMGNYGFGGGASSSVDLEAWMTRPGQSDVLLLSLNFPARAIGDPYTIREGVFTNLQMPTAHGTCCQLYYKAYCADPVIMSSASVFTIMPTTQIPYAYHVSTKNLVAPGGLIAPFY